MIEWKREASQRTGYRGALIGSELYKIVKYHYIGRHAASRRAEGAKPGYHAYFKPSGWKNWGNSVSDSHGFFKSIDEAKTACDEHFKTHGLKPDAWDRIQANVTEATW